MSKKKDNTKKGKAAANKAAPNILLLTWLGVIVATWISAAGLIGSIEYLTAKRVSDNSVNSQVATLGNSVADLYQQHFTATQNQLNKIAQHDEIYNALVLEDQEQLNYITNLYVSNIPHALSLRIIPWDHLGTAGLKQRNIDMAQFNSVTMMMLAKSDSGKAPSAEVYPVDKSWHVSFAAPVTQDDNVIGIALLTLNKDYLKQIIDTQHLLASGHFELSIDGKKQILTAGSAGKGAKFISDLPFSGGKLTTYIDPSVNASLSDTFFEIYLFIAGTTLALTLFCLFGYFSTKRAIVRDVESLAFYIGAFSGLHETQKPKLRMRELVTLLQTIAQIGAKVQRSAVNLEDGQLAPEIHVKETNAEKGGIPQAAEVVEGIAFQHPEIFRDYDIRGLADKQLDDESAFLIGKAIGSEAMSMDISNIVIAMDCRVSSDRIKKAVAKGVMATGCNITDIGMNPTPALYFSAEKSEGHAGIMVTGSHNPAEYNGLKIVLGGAALQGERIQHLLERIESGNFIDSDDFGHQSTAAVADEYISELCQDIITAKPLKVVVDAANGVGGAIATKVLEQLDCEVVAINCDANGNFPAGGPDPTIDSNLEQLVSTVTGQKADLGIAFDGDADRMVAVAPSGRILNGDQLLMIFAQDIVSRNPGCNIVYDVKSSSNISKLVNQFGGRPVMWKSGHSNIKAKMQEIDAALGAELTGHYFFKERWFGFDDGIYAAMRLVELLTTDERTLDSRIDELPQSVSTPELFIPLRSEADKERLMTTIKAALSREQGEVTDIDGIRIDFDGAWGLIRPSNTSTKLSLRFEATSSELMGRIQQIFKAAILSADDSLKLPF